MLSFERLRALVAALWVAGCGAENDESSSRVSASSDRTIGDVAADDDSSGSEDTEDTDGVDSGSDAVGDAGMPNQEIEPDEEDAVELDACEPFAACGGEVEGTWDVQAVCVSDGFSEAVNAEFAALPEPCRNATRAVLATPMDLVVSFGADGQQTVSGQLQSNVEFDLTEECIISLTGASASLLLCLQLAEVVSDGVSGSIPGTTASCGTDGNGGCACDLLIPQEIMSMGSYTLSDNQVIDANEGAGDYCVMDGTLWLRFPEDSNPIGALVATLSE